MATATVTAPEKVTTGTPPDRSGQGWTSGEVRVPQPKRTLINDAGAVVVVAVVATA